MKRNMTARKQCMLLLSQTEYIFPQNQQVYGTVATTIPYQGSALAGYFEIWASPRFVKQ